MPFLVGFCDTPISSKVEPAVAGCMHTARTCGEGRANLKAQRQRLLIGVSRVGGELINLLIA